MTLDEFGQSLIAAEPPAGLPLALAGLSWDAKGDWPRAQESAHGWDAEQFRHSESLPTDPAQSSPKSVNLASAFCPSHSGKARRRTMWLLGPNKSL